MVNTMTHTINTMTHTINTMTPTINTMTPTVNTMTPTVNTMTHMTKRSHMKNLDMAMVQILTMKVMEGIHMEHHTMVKITPIVNQFTARIRMGAQTEVTHHRHMTNPTMMDRNTVTASMVKIPTVVRTITEIEGMVIAAMGTEDTILKNTMVAEVTGVIGPSGAHVLPLVVRVLPREQGYASNIKKNRIMMVSKITRMANPKLDTFQKSHMNHMIKKRSPTPHHLSHTYPKIERTVICRRCHIPRPIRDPSRCTGVVAGRNEAHLAVTTTLIFTILLPALPQSWTTRNLTAMAWKVYLTVATGRRLRPDLANLNHAQFTVAGPPGLSGLCVV
jgi:hypothetical protein